jgi:AcrR family transcriptional regulator
MGRRKLRPDAEVIAATIRVVSQTGPARLTLAAVAKEAGLAPATLLQRFGSKRGLLLAVAQTGAVGTKACFATIRSKYRSPLKALLASLEAMTALCETPETMANNLAFLELDLTDPDFHRLALEGARATLAQYRALLKEAVQAGEIVRCDTTRVARALSAMCGGSMLSWAILREGKVARFLRQDIEMVIGPLRAGKRTHAVKP